MEEYNTKINIIKLVIKYTSIINLVADINDNIIYYQLD